MRISDGQLYNDGDYLYLSQNAWQDETTLNWASTDSSKDSYLIEFYNNASEQGYVAISRSPATASTITWTEMFRFNYDGTFIMHSALVSPTAPGADQAKLFLENFLGRLATKMKTSTETVNLLQGDNMARAYHRPDGTFPAGAKVGDIVFKRATGDPRFILADGSRHLYGDWDTGSVHGIQVPWLQMDLDFTDGSIEGRLQWNAADGTIEYGLPGGNVTLQVGQEHVVKVYNDSGVTINNGHCVYITGASGNRVTVAKALATVIPYNLVVGVATETIANNTYGYVTTVGLVRDVNTGGMAGGALLFLSATTAGEFQVGPAPTPPNVKVKIGYVVRSHATEGVILVASQVLQKMMASSDVKFEAPPHTDGDWLRWIDANDQFELRGDDSIEHIGEGLKVGNDTDYWEFNDKGQVTLHKFARLYKQRAIAIASIGSGASKPTAVTIGNFTGYSYGIGDDSKFEFEVPHDWAVGTPITLHAHYYIDEAFATNSAYLNWQIDYSCVPIDNTEAIDAPTHSGTILPGAWPIPANAKYLNQSQDVTIPAAHISADDEIGVTFERIANDGGQNNPTAEPVIVGIEAHYLADRPGGEYVSSSSSSSSISSSSISSSSSSISSSSISSSSSSSSSSLVP